MLAFGNLIQAHNEVNISANGCLIEVDNSERSVNANHKHNGKKALEISIKFGSGKIKSLHVNN